jgi:tetratricopeptide (TPR) repeat protein
MYADAEREFETLVAKGAASPDLFLNLGLVCSAQQKYGPAKERYFQAIDLNPGDPAPYVHMGADYLSQNKYNLALAWLYRATKLDHGAPDTLYLLGQALLKEEYFQTAHEYLATYVEAKPNDPKGWLLMGDAYLDDERTEDALASYRKALTIVPQMATAHYLVGNAEYLLRNVVEARKELLAALKLDPAHPEAQLRLWRWAHIRPTWPVPARRSWGEASCHSLALVRGCGLAAASIGSQSLSGNRGGGCDGRPRMLH